MYRLLIVDDEPIIVDGLYDLFTSEKNLNLDVYKANSAKKAMEWLDRTKIDIVLTDIQMPGMNGLQLMKEINAKWPFCKIIFLTAHNEFDYVYTAMQYSAASYVLKTEGEQALLRAVEKCIDDINRSINTEELLRKAQEQINMTLPFLQKEFLMDILQDEKYSFQQRQEQFEKLHILLNAGLPVMLLAGRIDNFPSNLPSSEKTRRFFEIDAVFQNYMGNMVNSAYVFWDRSRLLWLIQPKCTVKGESEDLLWKNAILFVKGTLETIQYVCSRSFNISISFILDNRPSLWDEAVERFNFLKQILNFRIGYDSERVLMDSSFFGHYSMDIPDTAKNQQKAQMYNTRLDMLKTYLESGQSEEFFKLLTEIVGFILDQNNDDDYFKLETYHCISLMFLSFINRLNLKSMVEEHINITNMIGTTEFITRPEAVEYFFKLGEVIFSYRKNEQKDRMDVLISNIQSYINEHSKEELSLVTLSEKVYLNPVYLSRIYKQVTGVNLSDYISDTRIGKAKKLLQQSDLKVHEIGTAVGYDSAAYFARVFKQATRMTPQEYRESIMKNK